ncbi:MAG: SAM-dependent methyltransferase, partial [Chloroflexota bacterium]|nr:SAM-dependent methyltransferase [Chloroflexota bacterium]
MSDPKPSTEDVQQHFTARAATYQGAGDETLAAMVEFAALSPAAVALDVATGTGAVAFELAPTVGHQ